MPAGALDRPNFQQFSTPENKQGYNDSPITHDLITDVYLEFIQRTRQEESSEYCRTRTG